ncbi:MAG: peptide deformylase [Candidatus Sumerlaeota bacterium]|nr:peptide deformylase [Candidatus Sumerlaeota bacterium]
MALLPIRIYGDSILRETARPISQVTEELRTLAADMGETMYAANGVGLAANQIGRLDRILVLDVEQTDDAPGKRRKRGRTGQRLLEVYLNPEILSSSIEDESYNEGCLSIPGIEGDVYRPLTIRLRWMDLEGKLHEDEAEGMRARVLQHEIDHLNGVLFIDHLPEAKRLALAGRLNRLKKETLGESGTE